jgi:hypothetical protein
MLSLNSRDFYAIAERHVVRMLVLILVFAALKVIASEFRLGSFSGFAEA